MLLNMPSQLASRASRWRYNAAGDRDLRLDLLRGFAVFAMAVDHVGGDSPFRLLSGGNRFFVSAAEAFVFISGVTVGIVYGRLTSREGMRQVFGRAWGRAWTLYCVSVWLALGFASAAAIAGIPKGAPFAADPARFVLDVVTLQRSYYLVEVMLLYAFLMALVPPVIWLLRRGLWPVIAVFSVVLWLAYQLSDGRLVLPWSITDYRAFPFAAWQLLFFSGLLLGWHRQFLGATVARIPRPRLPGGWLVPNATAVGVLIWLHITNAAALDRWLGEGGGARLLDDWFDKASLPLPRLLACLLVFGLAWQIATRGWRPLASVAGPFLLPLGRSALYAYSAHVVMACVIEVVTVRLFELDAASTLLSFALQAGMLGVVWTATRFHLFQRPARLLGRAPVRASGDGWAWRPAPALLAAGLLLAAAGLNSVGANSGASITLAAGDSRRAAYNNPVTTVTPPRASLKVSSSTMDGETAPQVASDTGNVERAGRFDLAPELSVSAGTLSEGTIHSNALGKEMPYAIYLPPAYATEPDRSFPVLYMLHGVGGRYTEWSVYGLPRTAADLMAAGNLEQMIIVMPEGEFGYWVNGFSGAGENWTDYMVLDVVPFIDHTYRTIPASSGRAIGGLSRGAFGALYLAFTHPDVWGIVGAHSPALPSYAGLDKPLITEQDYALYDPVLLARTLDPATAPTIWIDVGNADDWRWGVALLDGVLTAGGIDHAFSVGEGGHLQEYWIARTPEYLQFYGHALARGTAER